MAGRPVIIDVRSRGEFKTGNIKGSINIPLNELVKGVRKNKIYPDQQITIYCESGARAGAAVNILKSQGYLNLKNGGSISAMRR
ncbi:MAG: rhodanese-like domain-containing protein [Spirochaetales bacterium]|nr:rhodanese-like domain-containing protein [Spirochaetales bacterium]